MQDREDTDAGAEVFGVGRDGEHGLGRSLEQDAVDCGPVLVGYIGDLSRQREHDVEVRHRQELGFALGQPLACLRSLALRTVPIAAANGASTITCVMGKFLNGESGGRKRPFRAILP